MGIEFLSRFGPMTMRNTSTSAKNDAVHLPVDRLRVYLLGVVNHHALHMLLVCPPVYLPCYAQATWHEHKETLWNSLAVNSKDTLHLSAHSITAFNSRYI